MKLIATILGVLAAGSAYSEAGRVQYAGIGGLDFGCTSDGNCKQFGQVDPGQEGINQMNHFVKDTGLNAFRIPVAWQYLVDGVLGGKLDPERFGNYDRQIQGCIKAKAALCVIDPHNYARWNGGSIGQGGPTDAQFVSLWTQLAGKYKNNPQVAFGLVNEPHDLDIKRWAKPCQAAVTAIRKAGAKNKILPPGTDSASAGSFLYDGSSDALSTVKNPDGTTTNLIFEVHKYLFDFGEDGEQHTCDFNNVDAFKKLGNWLRKNKRKAILAETGGGPFDASCLQRLCEQLDTINAYSDVYLGWLGWAAGAFEYGTTLALTPKKVGGMYQDVPLVTKCIAGKYKA